MSAELESAEQKPPAVEPPGSRLRAAREAAGCSQARVADELRLSIATIDALEDGDGSRLPGDVFVRGYLRSYAALMGLPGDEIIEAFHRTGGGGEPPRLERPAHAQLVGGRRGLYLVWLVLLAVALGAGWWWQRQNTESAQERSAAPTGSTEPRAADPEAAAAAEEPAGFATRGPAVSDPWADPFPNTVSARARGDASAAPEADAEESPAEPVVDPAPPTEAGQDLASAAPAQDTAGQPEYDAVEAQDAPAPAQEPSVRDGIADAGAAAAEPTAAAETPLTAGDVLTLRLSDESWVAVHDARGERLLYRLVNSGEERRLAGEAPFQVVLGNAPAVDLRLNGEPVDVAAHTSGRMARFNVGQ